MNDFYTPEKDTIALSDLPEEQAALPRVLLVGDSISMGYTRPVAELLRGVCNVRRAPDNCGDTRRGLQDMDTWLAGVRWDLIHFNFGLHDLCHRHPDATAYGNRDKANGPVSVPIDEYGHNLDLLVTRMRPHATRLLWASTTIVPEDEPGRFAGDEVKYNAAAALVMQRHHIPINDLHAVTAAFPPDLFVGPGDVHFTDEGSRLLAERVAACIQEQLQEIETTT